MMFNLEKLLTSFSKKRTYFRGSNPQRVSLVAINRVIAKDINEKNALL